jgi:RNA polymerase sigma factor (sigma-70 family)
MSTAPKIDWSCPEFLDRFRTGHTATLEAIYCEYAALVEHVLAAGFVTKDGRSAVRGIADAERRADLMQEVFLKAFSEAARTRFEFGFEYRPYLLTISRNVLVDAHRCSKREKVLLRSVSESELHINEPPEPAWTTPVVTRVVERYVATLESPLREVHELRFVRGKSQRDAARMLGISRQNVRTMEARLKDGLRSALRAARCTDGSVRAALDDGQDIFGLAL